MENNLLEQMRMNAISEEKKPRASINPNDHYEFTSFGKTLDINNDLVPMEGAFNASMSREKAIWHVNGGRRILLKKLVQ